MSKIETYTWRDRRLTKDRTEKAAEYKMVDMSEYELQIAYDHCKSMLYNPDKNNLGRMLVIDLIAEQLDYCGAELALRWFKSLRDSNGNPLYSNDSLIQELRDALNNAMKVDPNKTWRLHDFLEVDPDYKGVPVQLLIKACRDDLGYFDSSKISMSFIYRMGLYFTNEELKDINTKSLGNGLKEKFEIVKYQLNLDDSVELRANPNGLNEQQFRDMVHLKKYRGYYKCKYSELTTSQLTTLRKKVLYKLEEEVLFQIKTWKDLISQIKEVAEFKNYNLTE